MRQKHLKFISLAFFLIGLVFLLNSEVGITGAFAGIPDISLESGNLFGFLLLFVSAVFIIAAEASLLEKKKAEDLEEKLNVNKKRIQRMKGENNEKVYYLINDETGEMYSVDEIEDAAEDEELKTTLRREFFSDLLKMYAQSSKETKWQPKQFIEALSPGTDKKQLAKRLKQYDSVYHAIEDKVRKGRGFMNPKRIEQAKPEDFEDELYVRFEDEQYTPWPDENEISFLPFDEAKVNPARGPLLSVIPVSTLIRHGYLLDDEGRLNPSWSSQKRQDYLRDTHGVDIGARRRKMIFFKVEKGTEIEPYEKYENIVVRNKVPLIEIVKKKKSF